MGLFSTSNKPKVTKKEFQKIRASLLMDGFNKIQVDKVEGIFFGELNEPEISKAGLDKDEIGRGIKWMREHKISIGLSDEKIDKVEERLLKYLSTI